MTAAGWDWPNSTIVRVIDGDTIDAQVTRDLGFGGAASFIVRLRLNRINAPALHTVAGKAARDYLTGLLLITGAGASIKVNITTLSAYKYGGPDDSPGEWMAEIVSGSLNYSDEMVKAGFAVPWDGKGPRPDDGGAA